VTARADSCTADCHYQGNRNESRVVQFLAIPPASWRIYGEVPVHPGPREQAFQVTNPWIWTPWLPRRH